MIVSSKTDNSCSHLCLLSFIQHINKMVSADCVYRDKSCPSPWETLFIWAVLQNRKEMATYFWEMVRLPMFPCHMHTSLRPQGCHL